ncbi:hypothetical protein NNX39_10995 [Arthrobacter sp. zg-Y826]|uniref:hypothetical protein n=1 Tax=Arthrobacter jinronghuae TaxID=2964609 RepID=UPI00210554E5|nr:hypothetical protein [Arthrobacter jinronghuae]MCQ1957028.1 hypothetical protein [Arthrobacter jinronghuae]
MHKGSVAGLLLISSLGLAGCSSEAAKQPVSAASPSVSASAKTSPAPTTTGTTTPATPSTAPSTSAPADDAAHPLTAITVAQRLQAAVPTITSVIEVTEANDSTGSIGQPGKYTSAAWIADTGAAATENSVVGGAVVEVFASEAEAQARLSALQQHIGQGPAFNAEYHYLQGTVLLRVSGALSSEQAALYEQAFTGATLE